MDFYKIPMGFRLALSANTAAMNRYAHLTEQQSRTFLKRLRKGNVRPRGKPCQWYNVINKEQICNISRFALL